MFGKSLGSNVRTCIQQKINVRENKIIIKSLTKGYPSAYRKIFGIKLEVTGPQ